MKTKIILLLACSSSMAFSALVRMDVGFDVSFVDLSSYPGSGIQVGDSASFSITYDPTSIPSSYFPNSSNPSSATYSLLGEAVLTLGTYTWRASAFEFEIWDDLAVLTPTDELSFRATMDSSPSLGGGQADVAFSFGSLASDLTFTSSLSLPDSLDDLNFGALEDSGFSVRQPLGESPIWAVTGGNYTSFTLSTVPEPSTSLLLFLFSSMLVYNRRPRRR
jgi:hypothetical protein